MTHKADPAAAPQGMSRRLFVGGVSGAMVSAGLLGRALVPAPARAAATGAMATATPIGILFNDAHAGYAMSVSGGGTRFRDISSTTTSFTERSAAQAQFNEVSLVLHSLTKPLHDWMLASMTSAPAAPARITLVAYDTSWMEWHRMTLEAAVLSGYGLDAISLTSPEPARLRISLRPTSIGHEPRSHRPTSLPQFRTDIAVQSGCRMYIQGLESATPGTLNISQVMVVRQVDDMRRPTPWQLEPMTISVVPAMAKDMHTWVAQSLTQASLRNGQLQLLNRELSKVTASVGFTGLQLANATGPFPADGFVDPAVARFHFGLQSNDPPAFSLNGLVS